MPAGIVDGDDIGMFEMGGGLRLGAKACRILRRGQLAAQDHLEGDRQGSSCSCQPCRRSPCRRGRSPRVARNRRRFGVKTNICCRIGGCIGRKWPLRRPFVRARGFTNSSASNTAPHSSRSSSARSRMLTATASRSGDVPDALAPSDSAAVAPAVFRVPQLGKVVRLGKVRGWHGCATNRTSD